MGRGWNQGSCSVAGTDSSGVKFYGSAIAALLRFFSSLFRKKRHIAFTACTFDMRRRKSSEEEALHRCLDYLYGPMTAD